MSEFILGGTKELDSLWHETARQIGILLCNANHEGDCSIKTGCGIGNATIRFNVIPIVSADGFNGDGYDHLMLVTPSKKHLKVDEAVATSSIRDFLTFLQEKGIAVFACRGQGNCRTWVAIQ